MYIGMLAVLSGPQKGRRYTLDREEIRLGRDQVCEIVLDDEAASRIHAEIFQRDDALFLRDLKSTNGTYLNNTRLSDEELVVENGDRIGIGDTLLLLQLRPKTDTEAAVVFSDEQHETVHKLKPDASGTKLLELEKDIPVEEAPRYFACLYEFITGVSEMLHRPALLEKALEHFFHAFNPDRALIVLLDADGKPGIQASRLKEGNENRAAGISISRTMACRLLEKGESIVSVDAAGDSRLDGAESLHALHVRSLMGAPLKVRDRILGMIYLDTFGTTGAFSKTDLKLCSAMAHQTAVYLENSRLYMELLDAAEFNTAVLRALSSGVLVVDGNGRILRANRSALRILGAAEHELIGKPLSAIEGLADMDRVVQKTLSTGKAEDRYEVNVNRRGHNLPLGFSTSPLSDHAGLIAGAVAHFRDLTAVRNLEEQVRRSQRLAALGQMAAGVAHEIRNPLNTIRGFAQLLREGVAEIKTALPNGAETALKSSASPKHMDEYAGIIHEEVERMDTIVRDMLDFSRQRELKPAPLALDELLRNLLREMEPEIKKAEVVPVLAFPDQPPPKLNGDADRLRQVFRNILRNAVQASPRGGRLFVELRLGEGTVLRPSERKSTAFTVRRELRTVIRDEGPGLPREVLPKIFDPFFTAKDVGTGLGLSISQKIVDQHQGRIEAANASEGGAVFTVRLPLAGPADTVSSGA